MAQSPYPEVAYEKCFGRLKVWPGRSPSPHRPPWQSRRSASCSSKIAQAPMHTLMSRACVPLATPEKHPNAFFCGFATSAAIGNGNFEVPDELDNVAQFGYIPVAARAGRLPQAQCIVLVECATTPSLTPPLERIGPASGSLPSHCCRVSLRACCCWRTAASMVIRLAAGPPNRCRLVGAVLTTVSFRLSRRWRWFLLERDLPGMTKRAGRSKLRSGLNRRI